MTDSGIAKLREASERDFASRERANRITEKLQRLVSFSNTFYSTIKSRIASLNQRLEQIDKRVSYLSQQIRYCEDFLDREGAA